MKNFLNLNGICVILLLISISDANQSCGEGEKVQSVTRTAGTGKNKFNLVVKCQKHVEKECTEICSWARSCRESKDWWKYGRGERSFVAGMRYDKADSRKLEVYCCISLASKIDGGCKWETESLIDSNSGQQVVGVKSGSRQDIVIRDIVVSPYEDDGTLRLRSEVCTIKQERSTCDLSKLEGSEQRDYRILLMRVSRVRSQLIRRNVDPSVRINTLMDTFFKPKVASTARPKTTQRRTAAPRTTQRRTAAPRTTQRRTAAPRTTQRRTARPNRTTQRRTARPRTTQRRTARPRTTRRSQPRRTRSTAPPRTTKKTTTAPRTTRREPTTKRTRRTRPPTSRRTTIATTTKKKETCPKPDFKPCISKNEANFRLSWCCQSLEPGCKQLCHYDLNQQQLIPVILSKQCSPQSLATLVQCASDFKDATPCCRAKGVLGGGRGHCSPYCNPVKGLPGFDLKYLPCVQQLTQISHCFWAGLDP